MVKKKKDLINFLIRQKLMDISFPEINVVRDDLAFNDEPWNTIPNVIFYYIFNPANVVAATVSTAQYGVPDIEMLEFLGDSVLELSVRRHLIALGVNQPSQATRYKMAIVSNQTLTCFMEGRGANKYVDRLMYRRGSRKKIYADTFESLLGLLYWWSDNRVRKYDSLNLVDQWLDKVWKLGTITYNYVRTGILICSSKEITEKGIVSETYEVPDADITMVGQQIDLINPNIDDQ